MRAESQFRLLDYSKIILANNQRSVIPHNKYQFQGAQIPLNNDYKECWFKDSDVAEFNRLVLNQEYIFIREYSGDSKYNIQYGRVHIIDREELILVFEALHNIMIVPTLSPIDADKEVKAYRRSLKIDSLLN